jgi:nucleoid-associated protein YgaU
MRTEYKMGLAIGLFLVIVAAVYYAVTQDSGPTDDPQAGTPPAGPMDEAPDAGTDTPLVAADDDDTDVWGPFSNDGGADVVMSDDPDEDVVDPSYEGAFADPDDTPTPPADPAPAFADPDEPDGTSPAGDDDGPLASGGYDTAGDGGLPVFEDVGTTGSATGRRPAGATGGTPSGTTGGGSTWGTTWGDDPEPAPATGDGSEFVSPGDDPAGTEGGYRTYKVQPGDNGFWVIAEKVYGDGKYYHLIRDANPTVDTNTLGIGDELRIPPKPTETASAGTGPAIGSDATGQRVYTVQPTDATGFWGIAKKVYGDGKYWTLIRDANPQANSNALQAGTKLVLPPKPETTATGGSTGRGPALVADNVRPGYRYYVVQSGDSGFWTVAQRAYGEGAYWPVVRDANPDVDSQAMQPGDRILIPPKPASPPRAIAPGAGGSRTTTAGADETDRAPLRPDFSGRF